MIRAMNGKNRLRIFHELSVALVLVFFSAGHSNASGEAALLSVDGKARATIVIPKQADPEVRAMAEELAEALGRISGGIFQVSDERSGPAVILGTAEDWPGVLSRPEEPVWHREDYVMRSTDKDTLWIVGQTPLAIQNGIWDLMHQLGFRQFFPGRDWEIWPHQPTISVAVNKTEAPDFLSRRLVYGSGLEARIMQKRLGERIRDDLLEWRKRNRMESGFTVSAGHVYQAIYRAHAAHFEATPEDISGSGGTAKLVAHRQSALNQAAEYTLKTLEQRQKAGKSMDCVSVEPSDGGNWPEDSPLGSPSNQAVTIANYVAEAIGEQFPDTRVAMLAYNYHTAPPTIPVSKKVIVIVSEYARKGGYAMDYLLREWARQGARVGIGDPVFNIWHYNRDLPGKGRATDIERIVKNIPALHAEGAQFWGGSVSAAWAPQGLGHYLISRLLWDVSEAGNLEGILNDFYATSFGPVAPEMRHFFEKYLLASGRPLLSEDLIGRMYRKLEEAMAKTADSSIRTRLAGFVSYVRYLELYLAYNNSDPDTRQEKYEELARFGARGQASNNILFSHYAARHWPPRWDKALTAWEPSEGEEILPLQQDEILEILRNGIANNKLNAFEAVAFSKQLGPWQGKAGEGGDYSTPIMTRSDNTLYLFAPEAGTTFQFEVSGGNQWPMRGPVKLRLYAEEHEIPEECMDEVTVPADKTTHTVRLKSPYAGLHRLVFGDGSIGGTKISWPEGQKAAIPASPEENFHFTMSRIPDLVFYVPKKTKVIGGYSERPRGSLLAPDGSVAFDFSSQEGPDYFSVDVPPGQDGQWWTFHRTQGKKLLMTVPPYLSRSPGEGLMPLEVLP